LNLNLEVKWDTWEDGICIEDNPFQIPPVEIVKQGRQAIIDYYAALEGEPEQPSTAYQTTIAPITSTKPEPVAVPVKKTPAKVYNLNESKLILIGDGAAGKTSLMKRLLGWEFNPQESQTHGININTLKLQDDKGQEIKLHCWDFGGQQIMHATHQFFLSKRCLYLLVIDSRRETQVEYWLQHVQAFGGTAPVIIVINKIDESPQFDLPQKRQLRQRYPNLKHICRLSCKNGQGLDELQQRIQQVLPDIELLNTLFPERWLKVKQAIAEQAQKTNYTSYEHYVELCEQQGINKDTEQTTLIGFLHDLGIINHFKDPWLRETTVINPQWITEAVYTIINAPLLANSGLLRRQDLPKLLDSERYPERKYDYILELMQKFELCYRVIDKDNKMQYLVPDLFPVAEPDFTFNPYNQQVLHFILDYEFLPKAVFTRFIVKLHRNIVDHNKYWRTGVLLQDDTNDCQALVETQPDAKRISLEIIGTKRREYLSILRFVLNDIQSRFHNLKVTEKIGLPDDPTTSVSYEYLETLATNGQSVYIPPENPGKAYKISELLGSITPPIDEMAVMQRLNKITQMLENQGFTAEKDIIDHVNDVVKMNPGIFGMSLDINELIRKLKRKG